MTVLDKLIGDLRDVCGGLPDRRLGSAEDCRYMMADIGLSAFSLFFMGSPSFLAHQRVLVRLRTITAYIVFDDWSDLLRSITDPKARSP